MKKYSLILALVAVVLAASAAQAADLLAGPNQAEDEIVRIIERILGVIGDFFGSMLDKLAEFLKDVIPFIGGDK